MKVFLIYFKHKDYFDVIGISIDSHSAKEFVKSVKLQWLKNKIFIGEMETIHYDNPEEAKINAFNYKARVSKTCIKCEKYLPFADFYERANGSIHSYCKRCTQLKAKERLLFGVKKEETDAK